MPTTPPANALLRCLADQRRADTLEALYQRSGRAELPAGHPLRSTYTGLWQEYGCDVAANIRDTPYEEILGDLVEAIEATGSVFPVPAAKAALDVCRKWALGRWA